MNSKCEKLLTIIICVLVLSLSISFIFLPKKDYSEKENRYLAKAPVFSVKNLVDGTYTEDIKNYLTDHFALRDFWIALNTSFERATGNNKINGIYLGKDDYLIGEYEKPHNTERIINTFSKFKDTVSLEDRDVSLELMLVPTSVTVNSDYLPSLAIPSTQREMMNIIFEGSGIDSIDITDRLIGEKSGDQLYYKTDHHWTSYGAYIGYEGYCEKLGIDPAPLSYFEKSEVTNDFHGTLSAKVNRFNEKGDTITVFTDPNASLTVEQEDTGLITDTLFNMEYLDKRDKYSLFLDNLHPFISIHNDNASTDRVLMLIKDSYANCVVPFLVHDFSDIYVFDTRYYKDGPSKFYKDHPEISYILILYNMNTIDTDTGIRGIF